MKDFFKYLEPEEEDIDWGLYINVAGRSRISPNTVYPLRSHPSEYYFTWNTGRTLQEYQINYITEGEGKFEDTSGSYHVMPGSLIIIKPGQWHRYHPIKEKGWVENYIGFNGKIVAHIINNFLRYCEGPTNHIGVKEVIIDTYDRIFQNALDAAPGHQQVIAGMIMKLFGDIVSTQKQLGGQSDWIEKTMNEVCFYLRENVEKNIDFKQVASNHNLGYNYFRKIFKEFSGEPPAQYHLNLKIKRAKELLLSTNKIVKQISYELGFQSAYYFSRIFKLKTGFSPTEIRSLKSKQGEGNEEDSLSNVA